MAGVAQAPSQAHPAVDLERPLTSRPLLPSTIGSQPAWPSCSYSAVQGAQTPMLLGFVSLGRRNADSQDVRASKTLEDHHGSLYRRGKLKPRRDKGLA